MDCIKPGHKAREGPSQDELTDMGDLAHLMPVIHRRCDARDAASGDRYRLVIRRCRRGPGNRRSIPTCDDQGRISRAAARIVKNTLRPVSGVIVEVATGSVSPSRSIGLRIAKEIEPGAVGLFLIGAVMTLQTGGDVKFQPRLIEVSV